MKAILVVDMPNNCSECKLMSLYGIGESICNPVDWDKRPSWCPLKPMPRHKYGFEDNGLRPSDQILIQSGWNDCLYEILGEAE